MDLQVKLLICSTVDYISKHLAIPIGGVSLWSIFNQTFLRMLKSKPKSFIYSKESQHFLTLKIVSKDT